MIATYLAVEDGSGGLDAVLPVRKQHAVRCAAVSLKYIVNPTHDELAVHTASHSVTTR